MPHLLNNDFPTVSVLMTAYNREKYIGEAIDSVLASDFKDFELIITDDCSTDKTAEFARQYAEKDDRIKFFINPKNLGQFANRNRAAFYAKGKYLKYLDSDDTIHPNGLSSMVNAMEQYPEAGLGFCYTIGRANKEYPFLISSAEAFRRHFFGGGLLYTGPSGLIIRKDAFERVSGFEEYGMPSDNHLSLKLAGAYPVIAMSPHLFFWRQHPEQTFVKNFDNHINILNNYRYTKDLLLYHSPLEKERNSTILFNQKKIFWLNIIKLFFKHRRRGLTLRILIKYLNLKQTV